jgi:hypothetical protein
MRLKAINQLVSIGQVLAMHQYGGCACRLGIHCADVGRADYIASNIERIDVDGCAQRIHPCTGIATNFAQGASTFFNHSRSATIAGSSQRSFSATS